LGWPIAHSREDPQLLAEAPWDRGRLCAFRDRARQARGRAARDGETLGLAGCNLTIPHKEAALKLVDVVEDEAARIGAINCVVVGADGRLTGKNYDGFGFIAALRASAPDWRAEAAGFCVQAGLWPESRPGLAEVSRRRQGIDAPSLV
jgi:shikimate dehydrogenase